MTKNIIISKISLRSLLGIGLIAVAMFFMGSTLIVRADTLNRQLQVGPSLYPQGL